MYGSSYGGGGFIGGSGFMGGGGYMGGMNSMYGGVGMGMQQQQQPQIDPATGQPIQNPDYQFDLRRDMQATIGGLNASLGLAFGFTRLFSLSQVGFKMAYQGAKYLAIKLFDINNILSPIKFLLSVLFGIKFKSSDTVSTMTQQNHQSMERMWQTMHQTPNDPPWLPRKIFGYSLKLVTTLASIFISLILMFALYLLRRRKEQKIEELKLKEEEERKERERLMEAEWKKQREDKERIPEIMITSVEPMMPVEVQSEENDLKDIIGSAQVDIVEEEEEKAYDGELNSLTFKKVKEARAFNMSHIDDQRAFQQSLQEDEQFSQWLQNNQKQDKFGTHGQSLLHQTRSEDGWSRKRRQEQRSIFPPQQQQ